ncbi:MAG: ATP-dependent protease LonB [Nanobdellota archaeon]
MAKKGEQNVLNFKDTSELNVPKNIIKQVLGQDEAVEVIKKAAKQRRHVLLIGDPGTGKSMLGIALSKLLPKEKLVDIVSFPNPNDENTPLIRALPAGKGRSLVTKAKSQNVNTSAGQTFLLFLILFIVSLLPWWAWRQGVISDVIYAASLIASMMFFVGIVLMVNIGKRMGSQSKVGVPKVVVDNFNKDTAPFQDATGAHEGALLGDVLHDPFQSGGLGTPSHERIVAGMIHKAHMGVLFIDEISTLDPKMQQELLTAIQEGKFPITGRSERSAGAMVRTEPVPCKFILIAAGNYDGVTKMHPALRSRITGYGYEVYMNDNMKDTPDTRRAIAQFIAQEVNKDKKIPHFKKEAVNIIIEEARRRANRKGRLTIRFRELGGIIRAAGDTALENKSKLVEAKHVKEGMDIARPLEKQISDKVIENKREYEVLKVKGTAIGRVNGLAVMGGSSSYSGMVLPIEAAVVPGGKNHDIIATGKLGDIAKEAVTNVSAMIKLIFGQDFTDKKKIKDIYIQFLQTYEGVEGDSASIAIAVATISALKDIPVKQDVAMTGSLSVRGGILPVGGVTYKIQAAVEAGIKKVFIPKINEKDVVLQKEYRKKIEIIPVSNFFEVLEGVLDLSKNKNLLKQLKKLK